MTKIAVIGDIFSGLPFSPYVCSHALSSKCVLGRDQKAFWGKQLCVFFSPWQVLLNFLMFQLPRTELSLIGLKSNFPHHDNCTNVWWQMLEEKRGELGVDKG